MERRLQILLLVTSVCLAKATIIQTVYGKLEPGQNITGNVAVELIARSRIECSDRLVTFKTLLLIYLVDWSVSFHDFRSINAAKKQQVK